MDKVPREFGDEDVESLRDLGEMVEKELRAKDRKKPVAPPD
jgi:hypothetical protein